MAESAADLGIALAGDDAVVPFEVAPLDVRGRAVQMGEAVDTILHRHAYPEPVARLLGEALVLTTLLGTSLKFEGKFILQAQSDGPVSMLVVDFRSPDALRAYASFDTERIEEAIAAGNTASADLLGKGHLALTIDQGAAMNRYQGVVALEGEGLEAAAHTYFQQSEQIPTRVRLAVAERVARSASGETERRWRAGGILVQFLPSSASRLPHRDLPPGDQPDEVGVDAEDEGDDDAWVEARALVDTVEDHELTDPEIGAERLLYRLFHERGVRVFEAQSVADRCRCSRAAIEEMLGRFSDEERADMVVDDQIVVTCEFCSTRYHFDA